MSSTTEFNSVDDFLDHEGSGGRRGKYLRSWTKDGSIRIWLHTRRMPVAVWQHPFRQLVVFEDKDTRESTKAYWSKPQTCWETEAFLKEQYKRDEESGVLEVGAPRRCSLCRMIDCVHRAVFSGTLDWTAPVFRFEGSTDPKNDAVLHAGGLTNMFGSDRLSEKQVAFLKSRGIRQSESWKQNAHAKLQYVLCIVNNDEPRDGVQIATQNSLVGEAIKKAIRDTQASLGKEEGNPVTHPFCIELTYDERAPINKRYHGRRIERIKLTPEVDRLIREEPPSLASITRPFDQRSMRPFLERHAVAGLPWDEIFDVPTLVAESAEDDFPTDKREEASERRVGAGRDGDRREAEGRLREAGVHPGGGRSDANTIPCDKCKAPMREDEEVCRNCGATYDIDPADAASKPEPPPKPSPARGVVRGDRIPF